MGKDCNVWECRENLTLICGRWLCHIHDEEYLKNFAITRKTEIDY